MKGFASATERVGLNREIVDLARKFGDIPGLFRSHLRLIIDACELNDRAMLDQAVEDCEQIANQINLPHYSWRVASVRALQATIEGDFSTAMALLDQSQRLAEKVGDKSALLTLPLQRMWITCDWNSPAAAEFDDLRTQLNDTYKLFPEAEIYVLPFQACAAHAVGQTGLPGSMDPELVGKLFTTGYLFDLFKLGEQAVYQGDKELAQRVYEVLLPLKSQGTTMGLMGSNWGGPVALLLGLIDTFTGNNDEAWKHLGNALSICNQMRAGPLMAKVHGMMAEVARRRGDMESASKHDDEAAMLRERLSLREPRFPFFRETDQADATTPLEAGPPVEKMFSLVREGDVWRVAYGSESTVIKNSKGMEMLSMLVEQPDQEILALDLVSPAAPSGQHDKGDSGPLLDERSRREYKQRVEELRSELEEAEELADIGRTEALREELDFISRELSRAFGLGGRQRASGSAAERARVNAQRRLRDAIGRIEAQLPEAGRYLTSTIKTGRYCTYSPI